MESNNRRQGLAAVELIASFVAIGAIGAVFLNYVGAHLAFFGEEVVIDDEEVRYYWIGIAVLCVSVIATFVAAALRGAKRAYFWHLPVAFVAVISAILFAVTKAGPVR